MLPNKENEAQPLPEPGIQQRPPEKTIVPLDPNPRNEQEQPSPVKPRDHLYPNPTVDISAPGVDSLNTSSGDPTLRPPELEEEEKVGWISMRHKSLLVLSIVGLLTVVYSIISVIRTVHVISQIQISNPNLAQSYQVSLYFAYASIFLNFLIFGYFLIAKNTHNLSLVLKMFIVLQFIAVFGVFFGASLEKFVDLLTDFIFLVYAYIVLTIVRSGR